MNWNQVVRIAQELPSVEVGSYHGYPALRVEGKFLTRLGDDHKSLEFKGVGFDEGEILLALAPAVFFIPDEYKGRGAFAWLSKIDEQRLRNILERRWRVVARRALVREYDASQHVPQNRKRRKG
jgi:hypothetical protein